MKGNIKMDFKAILRLSKELAIKFLKWFWYSFAWLFVLMFIIDIVSKQLVKNLMTVGQEIVLIPNFLSIHYVQNNGMAFGIDFDSQTVNTVFFICVSIIGFILIAGVMYYYRKQMNRITYASGMLMLAGCFGNLIDRAFYVDELGNHYVVDFIGFFGSNGFARFNVADSCLVIGVIMLMVYFIVTEVKDYRKKYKKNTVTMEGTTGESVDTPEVINTPEVIETNTETSQDKIVEDTSSINDNETNNDN